MYQGSGRHQCPARLEQQKSELLTQCGHRKSSYVGSPRVSRRSSSLDRPEQRPRRSTLARLEVGGSNPSGSIDRPGGPDFLCLCSSLCLVESQGRLHFTSAASPVVQAKSGGPTTKPTRVASCHGRLPGATDRAGEAPSTESAGAGQPVLPGSAVVSLWSRGDRGYLHAGN